MAKLPKIGNDISLTEQAYMAIKDAIINNKFKPKEILSEEALAVELGISRTPVRSALKRLDLECLITINSGRNAVVADISEEDMDKVFPIRAVLEPLAARIAASRINQDQLDELEKVLFVQEEAVKKGDFELYLQKDYEFHTMLAKFSDNEMLFGFIQNVTSHVQRFLILSQTLQSNSVIANEEHKGVLEALKRRDAQAAEEKMRAHVEMVTNRMVGKKK